MSFPMPNDLRSPVVPEGSPRQLIDLLRLANASVGPWRRRDETTVCSHDRDRSSHGPLPRGAHVRQRWFDETQVSRPQRATVPSVPGHSAGKPTP